MSADREAAPRWGVWLHAVRPVPELVRLAVAAEDLGAAALLLADEGVDRDLYVTLTAIAVATRRLALIPAITNPHSRHPVATAAALGVIAGGLAIRRQGIYFAMITLALAQMMYLVALRVNLTGGEDGIQAVPRGRLFGVVDLNDEMNMYVFVLVIVLAALFLIYRIINSPFGEVLKAIRENEQRMISLGYNTDRYKLIAFVLSATLAGLAGSVKALVFQLASLTDVHWTMSGEVVLMTLVGGLGTMFEPIVGAFLIIAMENYLAPFGQWVLVIQGAIFVVCVLVFRRGIVGELANLLRVRL